MFWRSLGGGKHMANSEGFKPLKRIRKSFPGGSVVKNPLANTGVMGLIPQSGRCPGERKWQPTPVFLPGESHGQRSLTGYSQSTGSQESDMT